MKKFLGTLLMGVVLNGAVNAATVDFLTVKDVSTSGGLTITANAAAVSGKRAVFYFIAGRSDLSTSVIQIQRANATGTTSNYTTVARLSVGAATTTYTNHAVPVFVGDTSYGYRLLLDSTTANSVIATIKFE